ncbi:SDR family NAD(P)-dependent oxidoreductase [Corynebacterium sp. TAE3-ERU12]|uniref:SDR family NAD(P)-dependent oxidoreductase n=1 Tax=Corynebacterium sp. TAE3-ERU12 TaxID=2849491 RepID=UPI001C448FDE|nr:SDR family NAD(P)-dependent oxidoreductase [Corynebacterium sp. TAE3-ERU12]MBV7295481.1 SDR family NAD(P)-dependent oxidoreductase [Corynebacterium sp. TAE3-ERU12]
MTNTQHVLILGGTSEIGGEVAQRLAPGAVVTLAARRVEALGPVAEKLTAAGAREVHTVFFDADDLGSHEAVLDEVWSHGPVTTAVIAFGVLGNQDADERDGRRTAAIIHTDFTAHAAIATSLVCRMEAAGGGRILAFSSIAGARVRRPNYIYGSAKAGLDGFLQGLQDRVHGGPVQLTIARPGFVIGRMTEGMDPAPMSSTPDQVADASVAALDAGKDAVWIPAGIGVLAWITRWVPRPVWRRMPR